MSHPFEPGESGGIPNNAFDGAGEAHIVGPDGPLAQQGEAAGDFMKRQGSDAEVWKGIVGPDHSQAGIGGPLAQQGEAAGDFMKRQGSDAPTWMGIVGPDHTQTGIVGPDHTRAGIGGAGGSGATEKTNRKSGLGRVGVIALVVAVLLAGGGGALAMKSAGVFGCQNNLHSANARRPLASMSFAVDSSCGSDSQANLSSGVSTASTSTTTTAPTATMAAPTATLRPTATAKPRPTATPRPTIIKFSLSSVSYKQTCKNSTAALPQLTVTLNNSASTVPVKWSATAPNLPGSSTPWAQLQPSSGTIAAGSVTSLTITPFKSICELLINQKTPSATYYVTVSVPSASPTSYKITDSVTVA